MSETKFNGVSLFGAGATAKFGGTSTEDVTVSIFTSATGESGRSSINKKAMLLSALTVNSGSLESVALVVVGAGNAGTSANFTFAASPAVAQ